MKKRRRSHPSSSRLTREKHRTKKKPTPSSHPHSPTVSKANPHYRLNADKKLFLFCGALGFDSGTGGGGGGNIFGVAVTPPPVLAMDLRLAVLAAGSLSLLICRFFSAARASSFGSCFSSARGGMTLLTPSR